MTDHGDGSGLGLDDLSAEPFLCDCIDNPEGVDHQMWRAAAQTLCVVVGEERGRPLFHELSKLDRHRYEEDQTERVFDGAIESLETIGWPITYRHLIDSSRWSGTPSPGVRSPAESLRRVQARRGFEEFLTASPSDLSVSDINEVLPRLIDDMMFMSPVGRSDAANRLVAHFDRLTKKALNETIRDASREGGRDRKGRQRPRATPSTTEVGDNAGLPEIMLTQRQFRSVMEDVRGAVVARSTPREACLRGGELARITGPAGQARVEPLNVDMAFGLAVRSANFVGITSEGDIVPRFPQKPIGADLRVFPPPSLPVIDGLASNPFFTETGLLVAAPGYHSESRTWLDLTASSPALPDAPQQADSVAAAKLLLEEVLGDFPLAGDADRAHAMAMMLQSPARLLIDGPAPGYFVTAPTAGTGKGMLVSAISMAVAGVHASAEPLSEKEEEVHKTLVAKTIEASAWIVFDNIRDGRLVGSPSLASYLTAPVFGGRVLGLSKIVSAPVRSVLVLNGNNISASTELSRRVLSIRLDRSEERPAELSGFKHPDLLPWVRLHREELQGAVLTMIKAWLVAGRPAPVNPVTFGSYESFSAVINGILSFAGIEGFLGNRERFSESADEQRQEMREFVRVWWATHRDRRSTVAELASLARTGKLVSELDYTSGPRSLEIQLGKLLKRNRDRVFDRLKIIAGHDSRSNKSIYSLRDLSEAGGAGVVELATRQPLGEGIVTRGMLSAIALAEPTVPTTK